MGLFGSLFYELKKPLETNKLFSLQKVKLKLFSLERDKNKKVFRTKTQKGPRGNFLDIDLYEIDQIVQTIKWGYFRFQ